METQTPVEFETRLLEHCREAKLSALQVELVELFLIERMTVKQIRQQVKARRVCEVQAELEKALRRLAAQVPGFWDEAHAFPRDLLSAVRNRADHDDRPAGVRGVTPAQSTERLPKARMLSADDRRLRPDITTAARLWANSQRTAAASL